MKSEQLGRRKPIVESEMLRQKSHPCAYVPRPDRFSQQQRLSAGGPHQSQQHLDRRALARAIRTKKPERLSALDLHGQIANGRSGSKVFSQSGCINGECAHARSWRAGLRYSICEARFCAVVSSPVPIRLYSIPLSTQIRMNREEIPGSRGRSCTASLPFTVTCL